MRGFRCAVSDDKGMTPLIHDYHVRVLLPCYRETPEMVRSSICKTPQVTTPEMHRCCWEAIASWTPSTAQPLLTCALLLQIRTTAQAVLSAHLPPGCRRTVYVCDDGKDPVKRVGHLCCAISSLRLSAHERMLSGSQNTLVVSSAGSLTCVHLTCT